LGSVAYPGEVVSLDGLRLRVRSLDAEDGTPIIDVKPRLHTVDPFNEDRP
jgi:tRNA (Thr-GGU) A37 N-methylase